MPNESRSRRSNLINRLPTDAFLDVSPAEQVSIVLELPLSARLPWVRLLPLDDVADLVLKLSDMDAELAALLITDLIKDDHRLAVRDGSMIELISGEDVEARLLREADFVVVDLETTGAKAPPGRITEVGAYRVSRGRIVAEFQTLVNPEMMIPPFIVHLTGITDQMVKGAPVFAEVADRWLDFVGDAVLVAHDAQFDVRFLNHELARVFPGQRMANPQLCTVTLSRRVIPGLANYRLHTVAEHGTFRSTTVTAGWRRARHCRKSSIHCSHAWTNTAGVTCRKRAPFKIGG